MKQMEANQSVSMQVDAKALHNDAKRRKSPFKVDYRTLKAVLECLPKGTGSIASLDMTCEGLKLSFHQAKDEPLKVDTTAAKPLYERSKGEVYERDLPEEGTEDGWELGLAGVKAGGRFDPDRFAADTAEEASE